MTFANESNPSEPAIDNGWGPIPDSELSPTARKSRAITNELIELASKGDLEALAALVKKKMHFIDPSDRSYAAWKEAVKSNHKEICAFLMKNLPQVLFNHPQLSFIEACHACDLKTADMLLDPVFNIGSNYILFGLQIAGKNGRRDLIERIMQEPRVATSNYNHTCAIAAICGVFQGGHTALLAKLFPMVNVDKDPATTELLLRGLLVRAARTKDPKTFLETLRCIGPDCKFTHDPKVNQTYCEFTQTFGTSNRDWAFNEVLRLCCSNQSSLPVNELIRVYGDQMCVEDSHWTYLVAACKRGHISAVRLLTDRIIFADPSNFIKTARQYNQGAVLALLYYKYGEDVVYKAEPAQNNHLRQLLSEFFGQLSNQVAPSHADVTPGNP